MSFLEPSLQTINTVRFVAHISPQYFAMHSLRAKMTEKIKHVCVDARLAILHWLMKNVAHARELNLLANWCMRRATHNPHFYLSSPVILLSIRYPVSYLLESGFSGSPDSAGAVHGVYGLRSTVYCRLRIRYPLRSPTPFLLPKYQFLAYFFWELRVRKKC